LTRYSTSWAQGRKGQAVLPKNGPDSPKWLPEVYQGKTAGYDCKGGGTQRKGGRRRKTHSSRGQRSVYVLMARSRCGTSSTGGGGKKKGGEGKRGKRGKKGKRERERGRGGRRKGGGRRGGREEKGKMGETLMSHTHAKMLSRVRGRQESRYYSSSVAGNIKTKLSIHEVKRG